MEVHMKGQFFVLGAILLGTLFFVGLPITGYITVPVTDNLNQFSENIETEFPKAMNYAIDANKIERIGEFSVFVNDQLAQRNTQFRNLWLSTEGIGGDVNITIGNYLDQDINIVLNISDVIQIVFMPAGTIDSAEFSGVSEQFTLRVSFIDVDTELDLQRDKINLYSFFSLSRIGDEIRKEIIA
jgi:hypothetical protein